MLFFSRRIKPIPAISPEQEDEEEEEVTLFLS